MKRLGAALLDRLQPLGRALMLPIAVLPIAALLLRLGQPDILNIAFVAAAGDAIFGNLGLLFAAGVAVGLARENHGAAALAGLTCYLVATEGAKTLLSVPPDHAEALAAAAWRTREVGKLGVPAGIAAGLIAGALYNRYSAIRLPSYLGFFGGRRFVPIAAGMVGLALALLLGLGFPVIAGAVDALSRGIVAAGLPGLFAFGLINRLLLVTGLHHAVNNIAWFIVGDYGGASGDLKRFFAGDPSAGGFMAGFFPVMMFGLPAACLAMYRTALPERRRAVGGLLASLALTSFLTGVTEPIEFSFLFLAPLLFVIHAVLTGLAMALMAALGVKLGFGFSAGLLDYLLNYGLATRPLLLLPVGAAYAAIYYLLFTWCIRRFDLKTPGRERAAADQVSQAAPVDDRPAAFVQALGGSGNLREIAACTTRLRLEVTDTSRVDDAKLAALGARGVLRLSGNRVQVVVGPEADMLASAMRAAPPMLVVEDALVQALMPAGIMTAQAFGRRLCLTCRTPAAIDEAALGDLGVRGIARVKGGLHVLLGTDAAPLARAIDALRGEA